MESDLEKKRRLDRERQKKHRQSLTQAQKDVIRAKNRLAHQIRKLKKGLKEPEKRKATNPGQRKRRSKENSDEKEIRRSAQKARSSEESPEEITVENYELISQCVQCILEVSDDSCDNRED